MNTIRRIVKNSGASLLTQVSTPASSFLLVLFIARFLGVSGLGTFASSLSILYMFQAFTSLGFRHLITREVSQDKSKASKLLVNASFLGGIFSIFMAGVMCLVVNLITDDVGIIHAVFVLSFALIPSTLALVCESICRGFERIEYIAISQITGNGFKVLIGLFILFKGYGIVTLMIVITGSHFLILCLSLYFALKCVTTKHLGVDFGVCKWIFNKIPVFAFIFIFSAIRRNIDVLILTSMLGGVEVGFYSAAYKLMNICKLVVSCYIVAVQPVIFRLFKSSPEKYKLICKESIRYILILTLPIAVGTILLGDNIILLIFKKDFLPSVDVLNILIWLLVLYSFNQIIDSALIAGNMQKVNMQANFIGMIGNICLNLLLIPYLGFIGAGIANLIAAAITLIYQYYFVSKHLFKLNFIGLIRKPLVATVLMALIILLLKNINLFLLIVISAIAYIIILLLLKTFSTKEKKLIQQLWKGEKCVSISQVELQEK
jgi:O-antigen/teichoic acid export membrane protein